jgi:hypothetical protein
MRTFGNVCQNNVEEWLHVNQASST